MARSSLARRLGVASTLTALALSLAACGGDDDKSKATDESSSETSSDVDDTEEPEAEESEGSEESEESSGDLEELSAEEFYPAVMQALQDAETMSISVTTTGGPMALEIKGQLRYLDDGIEMKAATSGAQAFEMVMLDKTLYVSGAGMPLPDGKKWVKIDLGNPNSLFGSLGKSMDPNAMFKAMGTPKEFELIGTEDVNGVETNHYNVVMDTASYIEAMELPADAAAMMPKEFAMEMWVDADNQPLRFRQEIEVPDVTGGSGQATKTTTEGTYSDFGADVDIEAPPASEVAENVPGMS